MESPVSPELEMRYRRFLEGRGDAVVSLVSSLDGCDVERAATDGWTAIVISRIMLLRGRPCLSGAWLRFAARRFAAAGTVPLGLHVNHALVLRARGAGAAGNRLLRRVFALAVRAGLPLAAAKAAANLAAALVRLDDPSYRSYLSFAERSYEALGNEAGLRHTRMIGALADGRSGRIGRALDTARELLDGAASLPGDELGLLLLMAELHIARGARTAARHRLDEAAARTGALALFRWRSRRLRLLREVLAAADARRASSLRIAPPEVPSPAPERSPGGRPARGAVRVRVERHATGCLVIADRATGRLVDRLERAAATSLPLLLIGETGTGKEVLARFAHGRSGRGTAPFVPVNMAAIPARLFESVLFGHRRGAFTGATADTRGLAGTVSGGTLFLDEIGDCPLPLQGKLLRFLDSGEYRPVGGAAPVPFDGRIVAATNRDLDRLVAEGLFRADLRHRLDVLGFRVPPLRERRDGIVPLARCLLAEDARRYRLGPLDLSEGACRMLERYGWPGNVRELRNELLRAAAVSGETLLRSVHFSERLLCAHAAGSGVTSGGLRARLEAVERREIAAALAAASGNRSGAAEILDMKRTTLLSRMKRLGIDVD